MILDYYERHLLSLAVEACDEAGMRFYYDAETRRWILRSSGPIVITSHGLADALTALLRDLGVEVPERPSAEAVASLVPHPEHYAQANYYLERLRLLNQKDPLLAAAVLESGRG